MGNIIRRRPFVSAKNPHKCDEQIIPANEIALNTPFSLVVNCKSHWDTGIMKEIPHVSKTTLISIMPLMKITIRLNVPNSNLKQKFYKFVINYFYSIYSLTLTRFRNSLIHEYSIFFTWPWLILHFFTIDVEFWLVIEQKSNLFLSRKRIQELSVNEWKW